MLLPLSKMKRLKKLYQKYIYGIIGTLLFHVILFSGFLLSTVHQKTKHNEAPIVIDFSKSIEKPEEKKPETSKKKQLDAPDRPFTERSNQAVNDANPTKNKKPFFDKQYEDELKSARQLAANVNKQLHKKIPRLKDLKMPEETTEGQNPDSISSTIYSGQSNIHYDLKNRYHLRLPIPVYLAQGGGKVNVDIWVLPNGTVARAEAHLIGNSNDPMLIQYAQEAALRTQFNTDGNAPNPQKGSITYTFIPQ